jgi:hypothetical protein
MSEKPESSARLYATTNPSGMRKNAAYQASAGSASQPG